MSAATPNNPDSPVAGDTHAADTPAWNLASIVADLRGQRERWRSEQHRNLEFGGRELPSREAMQAIASALCGALFPMRLGPSDLRQETEDFYVGHTLDSALHLLHEQVRLELHYNARHNPAEFSDEEVEARSMAVVTQFANRLAPIRALLDSDVQAAYRGDPAARSVDEVLLCYPGVLAVIHHRLAHQLYLLGVPLLARLIAEHAHSQTGIDIHPGAEIGAGFFIDHGTGVVIGETSIIGARVRIYQAVTLGAKRFTSDAEGNLQKGQPRHPIVEDDVVIYAGATVLGRITIGSGSTIGGNVWLTHSVPPGSSVTQGNAAVGKCT